VRYAQKGTTVGGYALPKSAKPFLGPGIIVAVLPVSEGEDKDEEERVMREPVIKFKPVHWWIALIALLAGVILFFMLHKHAY
jgi:hypothetical protein